MTPNENVTDNLLDTSDPQTEPGLDVPNEYATESTNGNGDVPAEAYPTEEQAITDINELDLQTEPMADVDMDELEKNMEFAPSLTPGVYHNFIFKLADGEGKNPAPWKGITIKGKLEAQFNYEAQHIKEDGTQGRVLRYQSANTFRSGKMTSSRAEELLFALGKLPAFKRTERKRGDILRLLAEASTEQVVFRGRVQWRHYDKNTGITTSTHPSKPYKKTDKATGQEVTVTEQMWPKDAQGKWLRHPGNEEIVNVSPTKETLEAMKADGSSAGA